MTVQRLSLLDESFLEMESRSVHLHLGGLAIVAPGLRYADVVRALRQRLDQVPAARKRVQRAPRGAGRRVWVDDPDFDLSYHVRHAALPAPGDRGQLHEFIARLLGRPLDRYRPLWELYVIEGLADEGIAIFRKIHLAMAGGDSFDPLAIVLDEAPRELAPEDGRFPTRWEAEPPPGPLELYADAVRERVARGAEAVAALSSSMTPAAALGAAHGVANSALGLAGRLVRTAPPSPLNRRLSPHRRFAAAAVDLDDLRTVREAFGGTVNDAVVTVVADAVGRLLRWRGHETRDLDLKVMVPVKVHDGEVGPDVEVGTTLTLREGVVGVLAPLPVMAMDPVARLYRIMGELAGLKESRQAVAADALSRLAGYAPSALHAAAARFVSGESRYNVALSNAPGPQSIRYLCGVKLEESYPFIPLAGDSALSVGVSSYAGRLFFGLHGDRDALFDIDELAGFVVESVETLRAAAVRKLEATS